MSGAPKLKKILLRFHPPGLVLQYQQIISCVKQKTVELLDLNPDTDLAVMAAHIISQEPLLLGEKQRPLLHQLLQRLIDKQLEQQPSYYELFKVRHVWLHCLGGVRAAFERVCWKCSFFPMHIISRARRCGQRSCAVLPVCMHSHTCCHKPCC